MHLSDAQASRFYDLLDSLTVYANAAFGVTDRTRLLGPDGRFNPQERVAVHEKIWADPRSSTTTSRTTRSACRRASSPRCIAGSSASQAPCR